MTNKKLNEKIGFPPYEIKGVPTNNPGKSESTHPYPPSQGWVQHGFTLAEGATHVGISHNIGGTLHRFVESFTHVGIFHNTRRVAFTLAEVLITLGIIGIVSAMTIPTLVKNYQTRSYNTSATLFERKLDEAIKVMNTQMTLAGHTSTESFVQELSKHFKTIKICGNDELLDCFSDIIYWGGGEATPQEVEMAKIRTAKNFGQNDWNTDIVGAQFANGTSALIAYNPNCKQDPFSNEIVVSGCLAILYDTSGLKNPNTSGKDIGSINVANLGDYCAFKIGNTCYSVALFSPSPHVWNACTAEGTSTDAEDLAFMSKYNLKYCMDSSVGTKDYWAGAVKACGGLSNMPSQSQLLELAKYLYDTDEILSDGTTEGITLNPDKFASLGHSSTSFYIWSKEEDTPYGAYTRTFTPTTTYPTVGRYKNGRNGNHRQAVCISN